MQTLYFSICHSSECCDDLTSSSRCTHERYELYFICMYIIHVTYVEESMGTVVLIGTDVTFTFFKQEHMLIHKEI